MRGYLVWDWYAVPRGSVTYQLDDLLSGIIIDNPKGEYSSETVWDDTDVAKLDTIADTQFHRNVDTLILAADKEGEYLCGTRGPTTPPPLCLYLPTVLRVREGVLHHPFDNLWLSFRQAGGSGCSEPALHSNPLVGFCLYREETCWVCREGIECLAGRSCR